MSEKVAISKWIKKNIESAISKIKQWIFFLLAATLSVHVNASSKPGNCSKLFLAAINFDPRSQRMASSQLRVLESIGTSWNLKNFDYSRVPYPIWKILDVNAFSEFKQAENPW